MAAPCLLYQASGDSDAFVLSGNQFFLAHTALPTGHRPQTPVSGMDEHVFHNKLPHGSFPHGVNGVSRLLGKGE